MQAKAVSEGLLAMLMFCSVVVAADAFLHGSRVAFICGILLTVENVAVFAYSLSKDTNPDDSTFHKMELERARLLRENQELRFLCKSSVPDTGL